MGLSLLLLVYFLRASRTVNHGFEFIIVSLFLACLPRGRLIMGLSLLLLVYFLRAYLEDG